MNTNQFLSWPIYSPVQPSQSAKDSPISTFKQFNAELVSTVFMSQSDSKINKNIKLYNLKAHDSPMYKTIEGNCKGERTMETLERPSVRDITRAPTGGIRVSGTYIKIHIQKRGCSHCKRLHELTRWFQQIHLKDSTTSPATRTKKNLKAHAEMYRRLRNFENFQSIYKQHLLPS